jgi:alpha-tubulin suppressor-like RCC1 family protein
MDLELKGKRVVDVDVGNEFSICLTSDGTLFAWGSNQYGVLGDWRESDKSTPFPVWFESIIYNRQIVQISAGAHFVIALSGKLIYVQIIINCR